MLGWVIIAHLVCAGRPQTGLKMARPVGLGTLFLAGTGTVVMSGPCSAVFQGLRTSPDSWVRGKVQRRPVCRKVMLGRTIIGGGVFLGTEIIVPQS